VRHANKSNVRLERLSATWECIATFRGWEATTSLRIDSLLSTFFGSEESMPDSCARRQLVLPVSDNYFCR
jgi:hypothetical protein